jgi:hypothetical protein
MPVLTKPAAEDGNMTALVWKPARAKGSILADVGDNLGRYVIEHCKSGRFELRLHGQPIGMFDTAESAKQRAQAGADTARAMASEDESRHS